MCAVSNKLVFKPMCVLLATYPKRPFLTRLETHINIIYLLQKLFIVGKGHLWKIAKACIHWVYSLHLNLVLLRTNFHICTDWLKKQFNKNQLIHYLFKQFFSTSEILRVFHMFLICFNIPILSLYSQVYLILS